MLYLIKSFGIDKTKRALKVGFSDNLKQRMSSYRIQNPFFEIISKRKGDLVDETRLHIYLTTLGYKANFLNEWFVDNYNVVQRFHDSIDTINKVIWKNRDEIFSLSDFESNNKKAEIYNQLRLIHNSESFYKKSIDNAWTDFLKLKSNKNIISRYKNSITDFIL